jgi:hypothetical protein
VSSLIKRLLRELFRHHSNPWSAWTAYLAYPWSSCPSGSAAGEKVPSWSCG